MRFDLRKSGSFIGVAGLAILLFMDLSAGSVLPTWGVLLLVAVWLVLFVQACRWFMSRPVGVFWLAVAGLAFWFLFLLGGQALWGWS